MDKIKLDFRFADDEDAEDIENLVNTAHQVESQSGRDYCFRKDVPRISIEELQNDFHHMTVKWMVLETPIPAENVVGAARFQIKRETKMGYVDILCAIDTDGDDSASILCRLIQKIEHIGFSHGLDKIVIGIPQWRLDSEELLTSCGYSEQSGHIYPEDRMHELIRPTMILEFHKDLNPVADTRPGFVSYTASDENDIESSDYTGSEYPLTTSESKQIVNASKSDSPMVVSSSSDLLSALESITLSTDNFNTSSGVTFDESDGGVTIDFDALSVAAEKGKNGVESAFSASRETESMEGLIENLFKALHKEEKN